MNEIHGNLGVQLPRSLVISPFFTGNGYNPAFEKDYKCKNRDEIVKKVVGYDPSVLPPKKQ